MPLLQPPTEPWVASELALVFTVLLVLGLPSYCTLQGIVFVHIDLRTIHSYITYIVKVFGNKISQ